MTPCTCHPGKTCASAASCAAARKTEFGEAVSTEKRLREALQYAIKQVPELATVPGIAAALSLPATEKASAEHEPVFWYRPRSDGGYEGPIHNDAIEDVRKRSGSWIPLYAAPVSQPAPAASDKTVAIGAQLANVAFNWANRVGHTLTGDDVALLDSLRKKWDAALSDRKPAPAPLPELSEADRKDAERWRFIRDYDSPANSLAICRWEDVGWDGQFVIEHDPDAAIDAAIAAKKGGA